MNKCRQCGAFYTFDNPNQIPEQNMICTMKECNKAIKNIIKDFSKLTFDERDNYPNLKDALEKVLKRKIMSKDIIKNSEFRRLEKLIDKVSNEAGNVAYQNRVGDKKSQSEAQRKFENALAKL